MNEEFEKEFNKLSEKDKKEVNNLIRFMQEKKYHDKQYEELLNQYIEMARDFDKLQSNWNSLRELIDYQLKHNVGSSAESSIRNHVYQEIKDNMNELESKNV